MLDQILHEIRNYFVVERHQDTYEIANGTIDLPFLQNDQYFRIVGSIFNDGVYTYPASGLHDEKFVGEVWAMAIPKEFLDLVEDIVAWQQKYGGIDSQNMSPYNSESFGGYTYSKFSGYGSSSGGSSVGWQGMFKSRLNKWRKI